MFAKEFREVVLLEKELEEARLEYIKKQFGISLYCYPDNIIGISESGNQAVILINRGFSSVFIDKKCDSEALYVNKPIACAWFRDGSSKSFSIWEIKSIFKLPGKYQIRQFNVSFQSIAKWE